MQCIFYNHNYFLALNYKEMLRSTSNQYGEQLICKEVFEEDQ